MNRKTLLCCVALLAPTAAPAVTFYRADLGAVNGSGVSGFIDFALDNNILNVNLQATGLANGVHFLHIHGIDAAPGQPIDTTPPPPPLPPNGDDDGNGAVTTGEAKSAVGGVILSLAPHAPGSSAELKGVESTNGTLSFAATYNLDDNIYEPILPGSPSRYTKADLLPLDFRVFDMHGGIVPDGVIQNGTTTAPGTFDINLPIAAGAIGAVPEAASWATMTIGFALLGAALRRRRVSVSFG